MSKTVSIALGTYNGVRFLSQQLHSLEAQTERPLEVVVGDDGSTDATTAILRAHADHSQIPFRFLEGSAGGPTANFARTMQACRGDIVMPCDQDDIWYPNKISSMVAAFDENVSVVFCNADLIDEGGVKDGRTLWQSIGFRPEHEKALEAADVVDALVRRTVAFGLAMAYRRDINYWTYPIPMPFGHDNFTALIAAAVGSVRVIHAPLLGYRQHDSQVSGAPRRSWKAHPKKNLAITPTAASFRSCVAVLDSIPENSRGCNFSHIRGGCSEKALHIDQRRNLPAGFMRRVFPILQEVALGKYRRYSNGIKSAARDCFFGPP